MASLSSTHADARGGEPEPIPSFSLTYETISTFLGSISWSDSSSVGGIVREGDTDVTNDSGALLYYWDGTSCPTTNLKLKDGKSQLVKQQTATYVRTYSDAACASGSAQITLTMTGTPPG